MKQPVLFIVFNRLDTTQQVFYSIKAYQPDRLYISADGARSSVDGEQAQTGIVRNWIVEHIDWNCEVKTLFHELNLGCGKAPATAISWFFEHEEEGIILEDDCVPNRDFFTFCEKMLAYYRDDNRISIISGCNFDVNKQYTTSDSYFFSVFPYTWGWATWRRNWKEYDYNLREWNSIKQYLFLKNNILKKKKYYLTWKQVFDALSNDNPKDIWDYQFFYQCFKKKQVSVVPGVNLISNIGSGETATHTVKENDVMLNRIIESLPTPLKHPNEVSKNYAYDVYLQKLNYGEIEQISFPKRIKRLLKRQIKAIINQ